jgi:hypothetical protein
MVPLASGIARKSFQVIRVDAVEAPVKHLLPQWGNDSMIQFCSGQ